MGNKRQLSLLGYSLGLFLSICVYFVYFASVINIKLDEHTMKPFESLYKTMFDERFKGGFALGKLFLLITLIINSINAIVCLVGILTNCGVIKRVPYFWIVNIVTSVLTCVFAMASCVMFVYWIIDRKSYDIYSLGTGLILLVVVTVVNFACSLFTITKEKEDRFD